MHDLIVVGGGPVGASLARAARGLSVALVAQQPPTPAEGLDARVYALSPGNVAFLRDLGAWQALPQDRLAAVHTMRVHAEGSSLEFDAYEAGAPELAWIVEDALLQDALWSGLESPVLAQCASLRIEQERAVLGLRDGAELSAKLVVGADGARSFVREQAGIAASESDYGQSAVVANFRCEKPQAGVAWQWFAGGDVLALLPLPRGQVSMVWSTSESDRLGRLEAEALCREVEKASRHALGELQLVTPARSYPLRRLSAARLVAPRVALAGQGLNLGLQDVRTLAEVINSRAPFRDPGELRLLRRYERSRAEAILAMDTMVDSLFRLFAADSRLAARLREGGLNLTDRLPVLKNMLMRHAMT
ncbi:MAG TPA: FAD-dependent monooxygenase [Burkholderiales bacterium]|nr:FAD-dependent monooxygenase [Burkholderiales bacterium]